MRPGRLLVHVFTVLIVYGLLAMPWADAQLAASSATATVPRLIRITGSARDANQQPLTGTVGITFTLYKDQTDQLPVWQEVQNVPLDSTGHYSVLLGSTSQDGMPQEIFSSGEARWLSVRPDGQPEQPRILFLSVAYALKAADSDMLGGKPASAFVLAGSQAWSTLQAGTAQVDSARLQIGSQVASRGALPLLAAPAASCTGITSDGTATANHVAKFTSACNIENSAIFESGGKVGIGNTSPAGVLDVSGDTYVRGIAYLSQGSVFAPLGTASPSLGWPSGPLDLEASLYNSSTSSAVDYLFRWQVNPVGNNTGSPGGVLDLLYGVNGDLLQTGFSIANNGILTFAPGQTFPGQGTVTSIATGAGLTGGPITKTGTISIPSAGVTNSMLANPSITVTAGSGLSGGGTVALGGTVTLTNSSPSSGGTVTSVATGAGLTGGPITKTGTISIPSGGVTNSMLATPSITVTAGSGLSGGGTVALGGTVTLTNSAPSSGGTVTSVASGTGLTGGPITTNGTLSLNTSFTDGRYLQLAGGALTGGLTGTTATFTGNLKAATATVAGPLTVSGSFMQTTGTATATNGFSSFPIDFLASSFNSSTSTAVTQDFRWRAEPTGNNSSTPSATMNLLFGSNGVTPTETGLSIATNGRIKFAAGQTFPGTGSITQVTAGAGLIGGGSTGNVALSLLNTCAAGQTLIWNGTTWICGSFGSVAGTTAGMAYFSSPSSVTSSAAPTNGQILIGSTGTAPALATLTAGSNITITNGPGSIQISAAGGSAPLPFFATGNARTDSSLSAVQNVTALWGFLLPYSVTTSTVTYDITTPDNTANLYDIGIYNSSGTLVLNIGPTAGTSFAPSAKFDSMAWTQGSTTLAAGKYYVGFTTNCSSSCAALGATSTYVSFATNAAAGASTGGSLPASVTPPADAWNTGSQPTTVIH